MERTAKVKIFESDGKYIVIGIDNYDEEESYTIRIGEFDRGCNVTESPLVYYTEREPDVEGILRWRFGKEPSDVKDVTDSITTKDAMRMFVRMQFGAVHFANLLDPWVMVNTSNGANVCSDAYATTINTLISFLHCNTRTEKAYSDLIELALDNQMRDDLRQYADFHEAVLFSIDEDGNICDVNVNNLEGLKVLMDYVSGKINDAGFIEASQWLDCWMEI